MGSELNKEPIRAEQRADQSRTKSRSEPIPQWKCDCGVGAKKDSMGKASQTRKRKREAERALLIERGIAYVVSLNCYIFSLVSTGKMAVDVVTFFSEADLRDKKICVLGKTFASFEAFYLDDNKSFIRKDLIYCDPTVVLSEFAGSFRVEIVYCPNPFQHADPEFMSHMKSNIETLNSVKSFLWPLGTVLYRMKKGSMYAWGWCKERTSAWFLRHYLFKSPPKDVVEFSDKMTSVVESHYKLFSKLCSFFLSPLLEFCEEHSVKSRTRAIGFGNLTISILPQHSTSTMISPGLVVSGIMS